MSINVVSATETPEQVQAALNPQAEAEQKPVAEASAETVSESGTEEQQESEVIEEQAQDEQDSEDGAGESDDEAAEDKPKRNSKFKKRVDNLKKAITERERELEYWKAEALKGKDARGDKTETAKTESSLEGKPTPDQFETHADYIEALTDWKTEQKFKSYESKQKEEQLKAQAKESQTAYQKRVEDFAAKHEDYFDVMDDIADVPVNQAVLDTILEADNGPELLYSLAKNKEEFERISGLPPKRALIELGKFEAKLSLKSSAQEQKPKTPTKAPAPITPVAKSAAAVKKSIFDESLDQATYERLRAEQMKRARSA